MQLLVMAVDNLERWQPGRIATITFTADTTQPMALSLVKREQTFAPSDADAALQSTPYDNAVGLVGQ